MEIRIGHQFTTHIISSHLAHNHDLVVAPLRGITDLTTIYISLELKQKIKALWKRGYTTSEIRKFLIQLEGVEHAVTYYRKIKSI